MLAFVTVEGGPLVVGAGVVAADVAELEGGAVAAIELELELPLPPTLPTELSCPVKYTDHTLDPPPNAILAREQWRTVLMMKTYTYPCHIHCILNCIVSLKLCSMHRAASHHTNNLILWSLP